MKNTSQHSVISVTTFRQCSEIYKEKTRDIQTMFSFDGITFREIALNIVFSCWSECCLNVEGSNLNVVFCVFSCCSECLNIGGVTTHYWGVD